MGQAATLPPIGADVTHLNPPGLPAIGADTTGLNAPAPAGYLQSFYDTAIAPILGLTKGLAQHPLDTAKSVLTSAVSDPWQHIKQLPHDFLHPNQGGSADTLNQDLLGSVPLIGNTLVKGYNQFGQGNVAGALGTGSGLVASLLAPEALGKASSGVNAVGTALDNSALPLSPKLLSDIRIPKTDPNWAPRMSDASTESAFRQMVRRDLPDVGVYGRPKGIGGGPATAEGNFQHIGALNTQADAVANASPATFDVAPIVANAQQYAASKGLGAGNTGPMQSTVDRITEDMRQNNPLVSGAMPSTNLYTAPGAPPPPRDFLPNATAPDLHTFKQQTGKLAKWNLGEGKDPNASVFQKGLYNQSADALSNAIPDYRPINTELSQRIPLQDALEAAQAKSTRAMPTFHEWAALAPLGLGYFTGHPYTGLAMGASSLLARPMIASGVGRGLQNLADFGQGASSAMQSPVSRLAYLLAQQKGNEQP